MTKKIVLFDCDQTLWSSVDGDYISSVKSKFSRVNKKTIIREKDQKKFTLNDSAINALKYLAKFRNKIDSHGHSPWSSLSSLRGNKDKASPTAGSYGPRSLEIVIGIVSDNEPKPVISALKLFGIWSYFSPDANNIKLWPDYCPKHEMVLEILKRRKFRDIENKDVFWYDDKDYKLEAKKIGVNFIHVQESVSLFGLVNKVFG